MRILYLIRRPEQTDRAGFRESTLDFSRTYLAPLADTAVVCVSDLTLPKRSVIPFRDDLIALISLEGVDESAGWPDPPEGFAGAYVSEGAVPVEHVRSWELSTRSPGAGLFTIFRKRKGLSEEKFLDRWYNGHTPLTLEVHPNVGYVRNRVIDKLSNAGPEGADWDGIVEEQYDPPNDLLQPSRFFGGSLLKMLPTMLRVYRDVKGFIDFGSIETWLTSEYRLK